MLNDSDLHKLLFARRLDSVQAAEMLEQLPALHGSDAGDIIDLRS